MIDDFSIHLEVINRFYETEDGQRIPLAPNTHDKKTEQAILQTIKNIIHKGERIQNVNIIE